MTYLWDTNILLAYIRDSESYLNLNQKYHFFDDENNVVMSVVSFGEILSLSVKLNWEKRRIKRMEEFFEKVTFFRIFNREILDSYAEIDAYSQSKHPDKKLPKGLTARNMGKNDIWIAATAYSLKIKLVTTDKDFDHLNGVFLHVLNA